MNKKIIAIVFILLLASTPTIITASVNEYHQSKSITEENDKESAINIPIWVIAFPKISRVDRYVYFHVVWPKFLINGQVNFHFDDGTHQLMEKNAKHRFGSSGTYIVTCEFDTIFGIPATGNTRVFII